MLVRLPRMLVLFIGLFSIAQGWALAMHRDVERGLGILDPILRVFCGGFKLPALTTASRIGGHHTEFFPHGPSPLPLFVLTAGILCIIWLTPPRSPPVPRRNDA
jgi:hypothetical protein